MAEAETKHCSNCKRDIPANNYIMHQSHCARNISLCKYCGETVPHRQMDEHFEEVHAKVNCECGEGVEKQHLQSHKENDCNLRMKMCRYCEMDVTAKDLPSHEDFCGSRTEPCPACSRYICIKDKQRHENSDCYREQPAPPAATMHNKLHDNLSFLHEEPGSYQAFAAGHRYRAPRLFEDGSNRDDVFRMFGQTSTTAVRSSRNTDERKHRKNKSRVQNLFGERSKPDNRESRTTQHRLSNPDDMDFLARHLAHDLSNKDVPDCEAAVSESDIDTILQEGYRIPDPPMTSSLNQQRYSDFAQQDELLGQDGGAKLPCEFCNKLVSEEDLILHQSGCQYEQIQSSREARHSEAESLIARGPSPLRIPSPPTLPSNCNTQSDDGSDDILMLPCEFCSELLPADSISFHQPMCDMNHTTTPLPSENNNHPLDFMRAANTRPKQKSTLVTKKNPLHHEDDIIGTRNNQFSSAPCQQDPVLLPSPVEKYATYSMSNFSSLSSQQLQPSKFYGNATKRRGSPTKKQPSSQSSVQAQETLQAFLDQENNVECSYTFEDGPLISSTLEQDTGFLSSTFKKTSNNHSRHGDSKNSRQGKRDPYACLATRVGQEQSSRVKNSSSHHQPANRSGPPASRGGVPANRSVAPANRSTLPANKNGATAADRGEIPANYSKKDKKPERKHFKPQKKPSDLYANIANNIGQKPSTENHIEQVRMFTERQQVASIAANGTKPKRSLGNQQHEDDTQPGYRKSHDQRARRTRANHHVTSRQMTVDPSDETQLPVRPRRVYPANNTQTRQVKKPPGGGTGSNYY